MTVQEALRNAIEIMKLSNIETPAMEAGVLLCLVLNRDRAFIYSHGEQLLEPWQKNKFMQLVDERIKGKPLQYITGHQEFMSLDFAVSQDVLIPRQDTETLVEAVIRHVESFFGSKEKEISILDIGTGSGCIAVSLAYYLNNCRLTAMDVSRKALDIAKYNADRNGVADRIDFLRMDLFEYFKEACVCGNANKKDMFDVVVSNPPYIPSHDIESLQAEVRNYEPFTALDGGPDGLSFYRAINEGLKWILKPDGLVALEIGFDQAKAVTEILSCTCFDIKVIKDLSGNDRVVTGRLKGNLSVFPQP